MSTTKRLYIIGPVTGRPHNIHAFLDAHDRLESALYWAEIPHEFVPSAASWADAMTISINAMTRYAGTVEGEVVGRRYDGVAMLPGWEDSKGACLEKQVAEACGIPCKTVDEWIKEAKEANRGE